MPDRPDRADHPVCREVKAYQVYLEPKDNPEYKDPSVMRVPTVNKVIQDHRDNRVRLGIKDPRVKPDLLVNQDQ